jgi:hypothetical protein
MLSSDILSYNIVYLDTTIFNPLMIYDLKCNSILTKKYNIAFKTQASRMNNISQPKPGTWGTPEPFTVKHYCSFFNIIDPIIDSTIDRVGTTLNTTYLSSSTAVPIAVITSAMFFLGTENFPHTRSMTTHLNHR